MTSNAVRLWILSVVFVQACNLGSGSDLSSSGSGFVTSYPTHDTHLEDVRVAANEFDGTMNVCLQHQTCQHRCGTPPKDGSLCYCDSYCEVYGDCCYDYWRSCTDNRVLNSSLAFWDRTVCIDPEFDNFYLISKCGPGRVDEDIRSNCEQPDPDDLLLKIPVSDSFNLAYSNVFCALCNDVSISNVEAWKVTAKCRYTQDDWASVLVRIGQSTTQNTPNTILSEMDRAEVCNYHYKPTGNNSKRHCSYEHGIKYCPLDFPDKEVANNCKRYTATVHAGHATYANRHCARCHGEVDYTCTRMELTPNIAKDEPGYRSPPNRPIAEDQSGGFSNPGRKTTVPITILVDFSSGSLSVKTPSEKATNEGFDCGLGRVFNPFKEKCIKTVCEHGKIRTEHGCINAIGHLKKAPMENPSQQTTELLCICRGSNNVQIRYNVLNESTSNSVITQMTSLLQEYNTSFDIQQLNTLTALIWFKTSKCQLLEDVLTLVFQQSHSNDRVLLENVTITQTCINENENMTSPTNDDCNIQALNMNMLKISKQNETAEVTDGIDDFTIPEWSYRVDMTFNVENYTTTLSTLRIIDCLEEGFRDPTCPLIALNTNEFDVTSNNTWIYRPTGRQFTYDEIITSSNATVLVCSIFSQNGTRKTSSIFFVYEETLQIINIVGVSCSLLCLFLTCIISCVGNELRTASGKIVINIAISLFLAQLGTLFAGTFVQYEHACAVIAALLHYLWLVAFMCMFVMSLTLFKSFRSFKSSIKNRYKNQSIQLYLFCCWGIPLVFVAVLSTLHFCDGVPFQFSYGDDSVCWIRDEFAALILLGIPMATILGVNSFLFVVIVFGIHRSKKNTRKIRGGSKKKDITANVTIYAKISCIMGLTWTTGCLASLIDERFLWYTFVILNSMQGVFIFLSFSATKLVALSQRKRKNNRNSIHIRTVCIQESGKL